MRPFHLDTDPNTVASSLLRSHVLHLSSKDSHQTHGAKQFAGKTRKCASRRRSPMKRPGKNRSPMRKITGRRPSQPRNSRVFPTTPNGPRTKWSPSPCHFTVHGASEIWTRNKGEVSRAFCSSSKTFRGSQTRPGRGSRARQCPRRFVIPRGGTGRRTARATLLGDLCVDRPARSVRAPGPTVFCFLLSKLKIYLISIVSFV